MSESFASIIFVYTVCGVTEVNLHYVNSRSKNSTPAERKEQCKKQHVLTEQGHYA